jgi:hypothetical protein
VLKQCHSMLWHKASQLFSSSEVPAARELFSAALQYANPACRAKNARMLSACHSQLGQHKRALEYLDIATRHEEEPSLLTQLMRLEACISTHSHAEAVQGEACSLLLCRSAAATHGPMIRRPCYALVLCTPHGFEHLLCMHKGTLSSAATSPHSRRPWPYLCSHPEPIFLPRLPPLMRANGNGTRCWSRGPCCRQRGGGHGSECAYSAR